MATTTARRAAPVRLTRRGRTVMVLGLTGGLLGGAFTAASASFAGSSSDTPQPPQLRHVVVHSGDTLWSVATRAEPGTDPRSTVQRIVDLNGLDDKPLVPGQQLVLPAG